MSEAPRDLGIDAGLWKSRRIPTFRGRHRKGRYRLGLIKGLAKKHKDAKKLVATGAKPQLIWGHTAKGCAPSTLRIVRGAMANASRIWKPGGCTTTAIAITWGEKKDPMFELRNQTLQQWFAIAPGLAGQTMLLNSVWEQQRQLIAGPHRWRRVNNHLQAVIATGVDLGWDMQAPYRWKDRAGHTYEFDVNDPTLAEQFTDHLAEQVRPALW